MFAIDSILDSELLETDEKDVSLQQVDKETAGGYGTYRGTNLQWASLVFSAQAARWVRSEVWHEQQKTRELADEKFELKVPYADPRELEMDVLRHGENVEVVEPAALRSAVARRLSAALAVYGERQ